MVVVVVAVVTPFPSNSSTFVGIRDSVEVFQQMNKALVEALQQKDLL